MNSFVILIIGVAIAAFTGLFNLIKDWKKVGDPERNKVNSLNLIVFVLLVVGLVATTYSGNDAITKQEESDSLTRLEKARNRILNDSLRNSQKRLEQSDSALTTTSLIALDSLKHLVESSHGISDSLSRNLKLSIIQLDTLKSVVLLNQKLNESQTQVVKLQNDLNQKVQGDTGFCYVYSTPSGMAGKYNVVRLHNPNKNPSYDIKLALTKYECLVKCRKIPFQGEVLMNALCFKACSQDTTIAELGSNRDIKTHLIVENSRDKEQPLLYEVSIETRANVYIQQLVWGFFDGGFTNISRIYRLQGNKYEFIKQIGMRGQKDSTVFKWQDYFYPPVYYHFFDIGVPDSLIKIQ